MRLRGPGPGVRTLESRRKLTFLVRSAGSSISLLLPPSLSTPLPLCVLLYLSLGLLTPRVPLAALFPGSDVAGLGCGELRGARGAFQGAGEPADPRHCQEHSLPVRVAGFEGECPPAWAWSLGGMSGSPPGPQACTSLMPQESGNKITATEELT